MGAACRSISRGAARPRSMDDLPFKRAGIAKKRQKKTKADDARRKWKNAKQLAQADRDELGQLPLNVATYESIAAPPSSLPAKKYCDITGLPAPYRDPRTGLRFYDKEVFQTIRDLPEGAEQGFLAVRKA